MTPFALALADTTTAPHRISFCLVLVDCVGAVYLSRTQQRCCTARSRTTSNDKLFNTVVDPGDGVKTSCDPAEHWSVVTECDDPGQGQPTTHYTV